MEPSSIRVRKERERCLALLRTYREKHEDEAVKCRQHPAMTLTTKSGVTMLCGDAAKIMEGIASQLVAIERKIEHPRTAPKSDGDFSLEEMAKAEQIIAEQEYNPFEG